ncbi:hypothetical protein B0H19DRAFT_950374 [Mycena capillaripes]|nr:hypothetical protein B0H19DRAFT_950374 [Mycena capillaripes]
MSSSLTGRPLDNPNPKLFSVSKSTFRQHANHSLWVQDRIGTETKDEEEDGEIDGQEVFGRFSTCHDELTNLYLDLIRSISDPEFPLSSLEDFRVVSLDRVFVKGTNIVLEIRPTQPHCSSAALIGLAIAVRLLRSLPPRFRARFTVMEGSYLSPEALCKQLNDKERVAAACESPALMRTLETMIVRAGDRGKAHD